MFNLDFPLRFENPVYALLGIVLGGIFALLFFLSYRKLRIAEKRLELVKWRTMRRVIRIINVGMKVAVILALSFLLATPYFPTTMQVPIEEVTEEQIAQYSVTVMMLMDVSNSMKTSDLKPTRLEVSKSMAELLVKKMGTKDRMGFISFAGEVYDTMLPTTNTSALINLIDNQTYHSSTAIGTALETAIGVIGAYEGGRALVLFSDGKNNWGINIASVIEEAASIKIPIFTVFVGTYGIGEADPLSLMEMSNKTGGKFYEVRNEEIGSLAAEVSKISKEVKVGTLKTIYSELTVEARNHETPTTILSVLLVAALLLTWFTGV